MLIYSNKHPVARSADTAVGTKAIFETYISFISLSVDMLSWDQHEKVHQIWKYWPQHLTLSLSWFPEVFVSEQFTWESILHCYHLYQLCQNQFWFWPIMQQCFLIKGYPFFTKAPWKWSCLAAAQIILIWIFDFLLDKLCNHLQKDLHRPVPNRLENWIIRLVFIRLNNYRCHWEKQWVLQCRFFL